MFNFYVRALPSGRAMRCPETGFDAYFMTIDALFGLDPFTAGEKLRAGVRLSSPHAEFWAERIGGDVDRLAGVRARMMLDSMAPTSGWIQ